MIKSPVFWTLNPSLELALTFKLESKVWKTKYFHAHEKNALQAGSNLILFIPKMI